MGEEGKGDGDEERCCRRFLCADEVKLERGRRFRPTAQFACGRAGQALEPHHAARNELLTSRRSPGSPSQGSGAGRSSLAAVWRAGRALRCCSPGHMTLQPRTSCCHRRCEPRLPHSQTLASSLSPCAFATLSRVSMPSTASKGGWPPGQNLTTPRDLPLPPLNRRLRRPAATQLPRQPPPTPATKRQVPPPDHLFPFVAGLLLDLRVLTSPRPAPQSGRLHARPRRWLRGAASHPPQRPAL